MKLEERAHETGEIREWLFTNDVDWIAYKSEWRDLKSIGVVTRTYEENRIEIKDTRY